MTERDTLPYTIHVIWEKGYIDDIKVTSNTMANILLNSLLMQGDFNEISVYENDDKENALFYILNGKYTSRALDGYWKIPLPLYAE